MLTTKERAPEDVPTPADGHATVFVDAATGAVSAKRSNGDVLGGGGGSTLGSWSPVIDTEGSHLLLAGPHVVNRFVCDTTSGIVMLMPVDPADGTIVNIKEVSANSGYSVQISANGSGSVEDTNGGYSQPSTLTNPLGISMQFQYDLDDSTWRLIRSYQPFINA